MNEAIGIATSGIRTAQVNFSDAAQAIVGDMRGGARAPTTPPSQPITPAPATQYTGNNTRHDVAQQMARLIAAKFGVRANIAVLHATNKMAEVTINIVV